MAVQDPYEVLGISRGASDDEIRAAYRELVKKYHPDKYQGNPLADLAQEKLQEVNEAYDLLMKKGSVSSGNTGSTSTYTYGTYGSSGSQTYGSYSSSYSSNSPLYNQIRSAINRNDLYTADNLLSKSTARDAEWYFLSSIIAFRKGQSADALSKIQTAMSMEPNNTEYRNVYSQMTAAGSLYRGVSNTRGYNTYGTGIDPWCFILPCLCC